MADRYMVTTKNPKYDRKTLGVKFNEGRAIVDEVTVDSKLGRDVETVATLMERDHGYTVEPINHSKMVTVPEMPWKGRGESGVESGEEEQKAEGGKQKAESPKTKAKSKKVAE